MSGLSNLRAEIDIAWGIFIVFRLIYNDLIGKHSFSVADRLMDDRHISIRFQIIVRNLTMEAYIGTHSVRTRIVVRQYNVQFVTVRYQPASQPVGTVIWFLPHNK